MIDLRIYSKLDGRTIAEFLEGFTDELEVDGISVKSLIETSNDFSLAQKDVEEFVRLQIYSCMNAGAVASYCGHDKHYGFVPAMNFQGSNEEVADKIIALAWQDSLDSPHTKGLWFYRFDGDQPIPAPMDQPH